MLLTRRALMLVPLAAGLPGCGALTALSSASAPLDTYTLSALPVAERPATGEGHLVVELPTSGGTLATDRILIKPTPVQAQYLPGARWSDPAPALVQTLLVASLLNQGGFRLIGREGAGLRPDATLMTEIQAFQAEITAEGEAQVRIVLRLSLIREEDRSISAIRAVRATEATRTDATLTLVQGFDRAMRAVLTEAVPWIIASA